MNRPDHLAPPPASGKFHARVEKIVKASLVCMAVVLGATLLAAEVYFAFTQPAYDVRTGIAPALVGCVAVLLLRIQWPDAEGRYGRGAWVRTLGSFALLLLGDAVLLFPTHPSWMRTGLGLVLLATAVFVSRLAVAPARSPAA